MNDTQTHGAVSTSRKPHQFCREAMIYNLEERGHFIASASKQSDVSITTNSPPGGRYHVSVVCALRRSWVMEMSHCFESHCQSPQSRHVLVCVICGSCANISFPCYSWSVSDHSLFEKCIRQRLTNKFWTCSKSWDVLRNQLIPTGNKMCLISLQQRHMHECAKRLLIRLLKRGKVVTRFIGLWTQSLLCREMHCS